MATPDREPPPAVTMAELLDVVTPQVERIEDGFKAIRVTLDALAEHLRGGAPSSEAPQPQEVADALDDSSEPASAPATEPVTETPPESPPVAVPVQTSPPPPVAEPVAPTRAVPREVESGGTSVPATAGGGGNWSQIVFGDQLGKITGLSQLSGNLLADVYEGDNDALGLLGHLLTFRSATAERKPKMLKDIGEAFYLWKPLGNSEVRDPVIAWLHALLDQAGIANRIEIVQAGDRFDLQRHNSRERGVEVGDVFGWVVLRENGKVYSKANVSAK